MISEDYLSPEDEAVQDKLRLAAEQVQQAVDDFDGDAFQRRLFDTLGINQPDGGHHCG